MTFYDRPTDRQPHAHTVGSSDERDTAASIFYIAKVSTGFGSWVAVQRRKKEVMSSKRRARLNKIGFVWKAERGRRAHRDYRAH